MEIKIFTLFWLGLIALSLSLVMLISGLLKLLVIRSYWHQRQQQQQYNWLLRELKETKPEPCKKTEENKKIEVLIQLKKEGMLTEQVFQREFKRLKFDKYWY